MKKFAANFKYLFILWGLLIGSLILTWAYHGNLIVDCGREAYYPTQILLGKVLYRDIFNVYGPFAYQFNAFLFKIFEVNLNILYAAGAVSSFLIINLVYFIAKRFMPDFVAFFVSFLTIAVGIFSLNLFNFVFPYSFGMLYGLIFVLLSLLLLLKYSEDAELKYFYLSCLFAGFAIVSKYDFFLYVFVLIYAAFAIKKISFKNWFISAAAFAAAPLICFSILFLQGLTLQDLIQSFGFIHKMLQTDTLKYFYRHSGVYPSMFLLGLTFKNFIQTFIPVAFLILAFNVNIKFFRFLIIFIATFLVLLWVGPLSYSILPIVILIWALYDFKNIRKNTPLIILILTSLLVSVKEFFFLSLYNYGVFYFPLLIVTLLALIYFKLKDRNSNLVLLSIYLFFTTVVFIALGIFALNVKTDFIKTDRGVIHSSDYYAAPSQKLIDFIQTKTKKTDTVAIFPEGLLFNFLTERKSDNYYSSLIPLYVETFGEDKIIAHFKKSKPDYIIFNNYDTSDYYLRKICVDYAVNFCEYVVENYKKVLVIEDGLEYNIFRKN